MTGLRAKIDQIPASPGCYIFKNKRDEIIYIGKSKCLKNRVKQYFYNIDAKDGKYIRLAKEIADIELVLTPTELDALITECMLVKTHQPVYNAQLKRKKIYPYLKISAAPYPAISLTEEPPALDEQSAYFGCFRNKEAVVETVALLNSIWQTPICLKNRFGERQKACLRYHINSCCAPCEKLIAETEYGEKIAEIMQCMNGNARSVLKRLKQEMLSAADALNFEKAAERRDQIDGINRLMRQQKKLNTVLKGRDVFLFIRPYNEKAFSVFYIGDGITLARAAFCEPEEASFFAFVADVRAGRFLAGDGAFLTACLLDIYADKLYVPVKNKPRTNQIAKKLYRAYQVFLRK